MKPQHLIASIALIILPLQAHAATATGQINVTATTILSTANVQITNALAFGSVASTGTASAQSSFNVTVTNGVAYAIGMDGGVNFNAGANKSFLKDNAGKNARPYVLYQDQANTIIWGPAGSGKTGINGTGIAQAYNVYGKLLAAAGTSGAVSDVVTVTVTY